jgi:hypothetical protein
LLLVAASLLLGLALEAAPGAPSNGRHRSRLQPGRAAVGVFACAVAAEAVTSIALTRIAS